MIDDSYLEKESREKMEEENRKCCWKMEMVVGNKMGHQKHTRLHAQETRRKK